MEKLWSFFERDPGFIEIEIISFTSQLFFQLTDLSYYLCADIKMLYHLLFLTFFSLFHFIVFL